MLVIIVLLVVVDGPESMLNDLALLLTGSLIEIDISPNLLAI